MNKKVTLSIDSEVYEDFQEYCDENAIMLSKKIELRIKDLVKSNSAETKQEKGGSENKDEK